jgi:hypothetical protein
LDVFTPWCRDVVSRCGVAMWRYVAASSCGVRRRRDCSLSNHVRRTFALTMQPRPQRGIEPALSLSSSPVLSHGRRCFKEKALLSGECAGAFISLARRYRDFYPVAAFFKVSPRMPSPYSVPSASNSNGCAAERISNRAGFAFTSSSIGSDTRISARSSVLRI